MPKMKQHLGGALVSGVGFGAGFVLGALLSNLIFDSGLLNSALDLFQRGRWIAGLALALAVTGFGGGVGGAVGGLTLSYAHAPTRRAGYIWRGALSFGIGYALVVMPLTLAVSSIALYDVIELSPINLMLPLWLLGAIFGAVSGLILGLLTVGRDFWRVSLFGAIAFAFGGSGLGYSLWAYLSGAIEGDLATELALFAGLFVFGAVGGGALGYLYSWLAHREQKAPLPTRFGDWFKQLGTPGRIVTLVGLLFLVLVFRALVLQAPLPTGRPQLATVLESNTLGTQWAPAVSLVENGSQPVLSGSEVGNVIVAWSQAENGGTDIHYAIRSSLEADWSTPVNVSNSNTSLSTEPQIVIDSESIAHLVWVEAAAGADGSEILYSRCQAGACTPAAQVSNLTGLDCLKDPAPLNNAPDIALDQNNTLMVSWRNGERSLVYSTWPAAGTPPEMPSGCLPIEDGSMVSEPRLSAGPGDTFSLVYEQTGEIRLVQYVADGWSSPHSCLARGKPRKSLLIPGVKITWPGAGRTKP